MSRLSMLSALALTVYLGSCAPELPRPPDLQPVLQAYANPKAEVDGAVMAEWADEIEEAAKEIEDSEIFKEILNVVIEVQQELEASTARTCSGGDNDGRSCTDDAGCPAGTCVATDDLVLGATCSGGDNPGSACDVGDATACPGGGTCGGGVTIPSPNGGIQVNYICPGWDERQFDDGYDAEPDAANGSIDLFMTLDSGGIGRVVWGTAAKCLYLVPNPAGNCEAPGCDQASYDGGIALDLGDAVPPGEDITQLPVTFVIEGNIGFDGGDFRINQSFRVILADEFGLVLLVDIGDPALKETFNYIFAETFQCIRDATPPPDPESPCSFGCSLERSECFDDSGILFSW